MKKALIITYYWPPASGPGVQRFLKFVKYFSAFEIHPTILTVKDGSYSATDKTLLKDVPMEVSVHATKAIEPFKIYNFLRGKKGNSVEVGMGNIKNPDSLFKKAANYIRSNFFLPDARVGWNSSATKKAIELIKTEGIDTIITTGPPHSTHLIGQYVKSQNKDITWIADFRDPWTTIYYEKYLNRTEKSKERNQALEDSVLETADHLVVVSEGMKKEFVDRAENITVIPNGYDAEDMISMIHEKTSSFVLSYIGNFKENQNIEAVWKAIKLLIDEHPDINEFLKIELTGHVHADIKDSIEKIGLGNHTYYFDYVKHDVAVHKMATANLVYLPIPRSENNELIVTGKIFEYLASHTPILAVGPKNGNAAEILISCGRHAMSDYDDIDGIRAHLLNEFLYWKQNGKLGRKEEDETYIKYERKNLTKKYSELIYRLNS